MSAQLPPTWRAGTVFILTVWAATVLLFIGNGIRAVLS